MENRENKIIFSLIVANIVLIIIFCSGLMLKSHKKNLNSARLAFIPENSMISWILLVSGNESLELQNTDNGWRGVKDSFDFLTDENVVKGFLEELKKIHPAVILSSSLSEIHRYGLDEDNVFKIKLFAENGTVISDLNFGFENNLGENISYYSGIDNHIYSIDGAISSYLNLKTSYWGELDLFYKGFDYNKLQGFTFISYDTSGSIENRVEIIKNDGNSWSLNNSFNNSKPVILPDTDIKEYFRKVSLLRALDISNAGRDKLSGEKYSLTFQWGDGSVDSFLIYEEAEDMTLFSGFSDTWYTISSYTLEKLLPDFL